VCGVGEDEEGGDSENSLLKDVIHTSRCAHVISKVFSLASKQNQAASLGKLMKECMSPILIGLQCKTIVPC
jgi:hypothetical protein